MSCCPQLKTPNPVLGQGEVDLLPPSSHKVLAQLMRLSDVRRLHDNRVRQGQLLQLSSHQVLAYRLPALA